MLQDAANWATVAGLPISITSLVITILSYLAPGARIPHQLRLFLLLLTTASFTFYGGVLAGKTLDQTYLNIDHPGNTAEIPDKTVISGHYKNLPPNSAIWVYVMGTIERKYYFTAFFILISAS